MINKLKGIITEKTEKTISITIFDVVSIDFFVINSENFILNQEYLIYTAMLFSSEKGYSCYGFLELIEKKYFLVLQDCHGIGAKLALQILYHLSLNQIYHAIIAENKLIFESVPGVGKKKAEMIIVELKSKLAQCVPSVNTNDVLLYEDFTAALKALGYSLKEITNIIDLIYKDPAKKDYSLTQLIQTALLLKK